MMTCLEIKELALQALASVVDKSLVESGFSRNRRAFVFARELNDAKQRIVFTTHCHPKYQPGAAAHIYPSLQILMPIVSQKALALVKGDKMLLAGTPEIIIGQPIEFTAPKGEHQRWFATENEQFVAACESILAFVSRWVLPFLSGASTPTDFVKLYETNDPRIVKQKHWHIFIVAAYEVLGQLDNARQVVREQFGSPGLRKRYAPLFASVGVE